MNSRDCIKHCTVIATAGITALIWSRPIRTRAGHFLYPYTWGNTILRMSMAIEVVQKGSISVETQLSYFCNHCDYIMDFFFFFFKDCLSNWPSDDVPVIWEYSFNIKKYKFISVEFRNIMLEYIFKF